MKIQPLQQVADHFVRWRDADNHEMAHVDGDVRSLKWKLWHGQTDRALDQLETMTSDLAKLWERGNLSATRLLHLAQPLQTYVRSNKSKRYEHTRGCPVCSGDYVTLANRLGIQNWRMASTTAGMSRHAF